MTQETTNGATTLLRNLSGQSVVAVMVVLGAVGLAVVMSRTEPILAPLWLLAVTAGFTLQRSRFCFASAFRDLFLFGSSRMMKGIIVGLAIATPVPEAPSL